MSTGSGIHLMTITPSSPVIIRNRAFDVECPVSRSFENHDQRMFPVIVRIRNPNHSVTERLLIAFDAVRFRPSLTLVSRHDKHGPLIVMRELLRERQLHLSTCSLPHKGFPNAKRRPL